LGLQSTSKNRNQKSGTFDEPDNSSSGIQLVLFLNGWFYSYKLHQPEKDGRQKLTVLF
jgi:hypothetical protein